MAGTGSPRCASRRIPVARGVLTRSSRWLLLILLITPDGRSQAQDDSLSLYRKIEKYSEKNGVIRWIYDAIFVAPVSDEAPVAAKVPRRRIDPNLKYSGRIIRTVDVRVFDPFGFSVDDTTRIPRSWLQRRANGLHRRTRENIVRNLLLVRPQDTLDPLEITESERVLRASPIVTEAAIRVVRVAGTRDSVDLIVLVHDKWSIDVSGEGDLGSASMTLRDRNFLGWGQELEQQAVYGFGAPQVELNGHHSIYNIKRSHITSTLSYFTSADVDQLGLAFDRSFYSPLAKWAGGVALGKTWSSDLRTDSLTGTITSYPVAPVGLDAWLARSFSIGDGKSVVSQSSKIIVGGRYALTNYATRPPFDVDTLRIYANSSLYLMSVGLSIRQYYEERFLYRFGATEDVPEGLLCTVTAGALKKEATRTSPYVGVEVSRGANTDRFGYISATLGYGTFFQQREAVDGTLRIGLTYFSDLATLGRWHLRQFIRVNSIIGFNKPVTARLSLAGDQLYGFESGGLEGVHKTVLNLETIAYAPYSLLGFRFAPVLFIGFGNIGGESDPLLSGRIYSAFALGLLIRNENLLVRSFEISVGFYPYLPDGNTAMLRMNPAASYSLRARDFDFSKPGVIGF